MPVGLCLSDKSMGRSVSICITRYAECNALLARSLAAALAQEGVGGEVLFFDQAPDGGFVESGFSQQNLALRIIDGPCGGLSDARNRGLAQAQNDLVLFLDADAIAEPDWAKKLAEVLDQGDVAVAGGQVVPGWPRKPPFFTGARVLRDQYSMLELGEETKPVDRVVGAGFGVDKGKLPTGFAFDEKFGRRNGRLFGGEETDFCNRARALGLQVLYVGGARVTHLVDAERLTIGWVMRRMVYAGYGRAMQGGAPNPSAPPQAIDWLLLPFYLPPYAVGWVWGKLAR